MKVTRVLVVEDDAIVAMHLERVVRQLGYEVLDIIAAGEDAIQKADQLRPDIILMDIRLRGEMTGIEAAIQIHLTNDIPIVFLTAYADEPILQRVKFSNPYAYLTKPVRDKELQASIEVAIYKHQADRKLKHLNYVLHAIRNVNQLITHQKDPQQLLEEACKILVQARDYALVWIGRQAGFGTFSLMASAGNGGDILRIIQQTDSQDALTLEFPWETALHNLRPAACQNISLDPLFEPFYAAALERGLASVAAVPMLSAQNLMGILCVFSNIPQVFDQEELDLLQELANDLAYGLRHIQDEKERQLAEQALIESQAALRQSEEKYRLITENSSDLVAHLSSDWRYTYVSPSYEKSIGFSPQELIGKNAMDLLHPEDLPGFLSDLHAAIRDGRNDIRAEYRIQTVRHDYRWVESLVRLVYNAYNEVALVQLNSRDLTERKQIEAELRRSEERYRSLFESVPIGLYRSALDGKIIEVNQALLDILAYPEREMLLESLVTDSYINLQDRQRWLETMNQEGIVRGFESQWLRFDGEITWVRETSKVVRNEVGEIQYFEGAVEDFSERKRAEKLIQKRVVELEVLYENSLAINLLQEPKEIGQKTVHNLARRLGWEFVSIWIIQQDALEINLLAFHLSNNGVKNDETNLDMERKITLAGLGLVSSVIHRGKVTRSNELRFEEIFGVIEENMISGLYVPIKIGDALIGCLCVESTDENTFSEEDERLLTTVAGQVAVAIENARLFAEVRRWASQMATLAQFGGMLAETLELSKVYQRLTNAVYQLLPDMCSLFISIYDQQSERIRCVWADADGVSIGTGKIPELPLDRDGVGLQSQVILKGHPLVVNDYGAFYQDLPEIEVQSLEGLARSGLYVPMIAQGNTIGLLQVQSCTPKRFKEADIEVMQLVANTAAITLENARLYQAGQGELVERRRAEEALRLLNQELEQRVNERTRELRSANAELERASRLKDEFLASMSHELRTPLTGVLNLSEALQEQVYGPLTEKQFKSLRTIEDSGRHLLGLINDILDFSKIEAGQFKLQLEQCYVSDICQSSLQMVRGLAQKKQHNLSFTLKPTDMEVTADPRRLKQILVNLLSNAVKFTPDGGAIGLEVMGDEQEQVVRFIVWDKGIGISKTDQQRLFRPFTQLDSSLSRQQSGTGLGLILVQRFADLHGGSVEVESAVGKGSRFSIVLPWVKTGPGRGVERFTRYESATRLPESQASTQPFKDIRVLLVDDNETNIAIYSDYLTTVGYHVLTAVNGIQGVGLALEQHPQIILMDIQMPGISGFEAIRRIRAQADEAAASIPIVALTALAMAGDRERCLEAGATDYLSKPISFRALIDMIEQIRERPGGGL